MRSIEEIFHDRTHYDFDDREVELNILQEIYDLMKLGPTSANSCPLRIIFVRSQEEKEKLCGCVFKGNVEKVRSAPVTALFAYDRRFFDKMDKLFAHNPGMKDLFASNPAAAKDTAERNSTLQAAYFMIIARGFGLGVGAMSGFDKVAVNKAFLSGSDWEINFLCNLGYVSGNPQQPRLPRLDFDEACRVI